MTRDAEHTPSPQSVVVPKFGDIVENGWASEDNPTRRGFFVREFKRTGKLNPGRTWEITDGKGKFWEFKPSDIGERLSVSAAPAPSSLAGGSVGRLSALLSSDHLRGDYPIAGLGAVSWNDLRDLLAALSPEAPAREWSTDDMRELVTDEQVRWLVSATDVAQGRARLKDILNALTPRHEAPASDSEAMQRSMQQILDHDEAPAEGAGEDDSLSGDKGRKLAVSIASSVVEPTTHDDQCGCIQCEAHDAALRSAKTTIAHLRARSSAPEAREGEAVAWSLDFGMGVNAMTTFSTKDKAEYYAGGCLDPAPTVVPLYAAPSADKLRIGLDEIERLVNQSGAIPKGELRSILAALKAEG